MKKILEMFLVLGLTANSYAIPQLKPNKQRLPKPFKQSKMSDSKAEIYIPADKRHQGLSRFDLLPFTDRQKGDPDRYRAVNPNYVKKENGHYYFALNVRPQTHYFDENLKDKGILSDASVQVDLTQIKVAKANNNQSVKYVYVKDKGYAPMNSLAQTLSEIKAGRWFQFPLKRGEHQLYDGTGIARGKIAANSVKLNYGQKKEINKENYYYAFSTKIVVNETSETMGASGWIKASSIQEGNDPQYDAKFLEKMQIPTGSNDTFTDYEITGGNPQEIIGKDENGKTKYKFGYINESGEFIAYKVLPNIPLDGNQSVAATDYLKRADDVINLGFNIAGVSNDTFRINGANRPLIFHRSADKEATAVIDLFIQKTQLTMESKLSEK